MSIHYFTVKSNVFPHHTHYCTSTNENSYCSTYYMGERQFEQIIMSSCINTSQTCIIIIIIIIIIMVMIKPQSCYIGSSSSSIGIYVAFD